MDAVFTDKCGTALRQDGTRFENARGDLSERTRKFAPDVIQFTESLPRDETTRILARQLLRAGTVEFGRSPYVTARKHGHPERSAVERTAPAVTARSRRSPLSHERRESNVTPLPRSARPSPTTINPHRHNGRANLLMNAADQPEERSGLLHHLAHDKGLAACRGRRTGRTHRWRRSTVTE